MTMHVRTRSTRLLASGLTLGLATLALTGCSVAGGDDGSDGTDKVVLVTHESFSLPDEVVEKFESESGYDLVVRAAGDAGELSSKLALTADNPTGDAVFGVDNTFASRVVGAGALEPHEVELPAGAEKFALADGADVLAPVDVSHVCVNVDTEWFARKKLTPPATLDDLTDEKYADLTVLPGASTSSPGMAFLLTTIAAKGDGWKTYWKDLLGNGAKVVNGWSDAYYTDFTAGGENGKRPIVLSYDSSPAFTVDEETGESSTAALLDTCFRQVEYAGVLKGADNVEGARELVQFLVGLDVQNALPDSMYVSPVADEAEVPAEWSQHATPPTDAWVVEPAEIAANRDTWLREWTEVVTR